ncbi:unnamed protein product [Closterium sp. Yama58-4]|nr:unnamed protein product [Closterium sp. Yama58-4]
MSRAGDTGAGGAGAGGPGAGGADAGGIGARGDGGTGVASPEGTGARGVVEPLSPQQLREWFARRTRLRSRAAGAGDIAAGGVGAGGARAGDAGVGATGVGGAGAGGTGTGGAGAGGTGAVGTGAAGAGAGGPGTGGGGAGGAGTRGAGAGGTGAGGTGAGGAGAGGPVQQRPLFLPPPQLSSVPPESVLRQVLSLPSSTALPPDSPLPAPPPYTEQPVSLTERREPASRPASPVCTRVPLPSPLASSLPDVPDPESDRVRAASPTVTRLLAIVVTDSSFESTAASALVAKLVDFAAACRLDYAASLVGESESVCPPSVGGECALGMDVREDRQEDFECLAAAVPHLVAMLLAPEGDPDALDIPTLRFYAEAITVPPPGVNIVDGMWIFKVKRPPGSPPVFKARYVARGFKHVAAQRDYELHSLDFSTTFLQGSLHEEIWLRRPPGFTGSFPASTQWSLRRPVYGLRQAPREWHDTLRTALAALGFAPSIADPSLFLRTDISLPLFNILVYVEDLVFATVDTEALALVKSEL